MAIFTDVLLDATKNGRKLPTNEYKESGLHPIIDQGQNYVAGYTNETEGLFSNVPAIIFGDHTRVIKYVDTPFFIGADGVKILKAKDNKANYKFLYYALSSAKIPNTGYNRHFKWLKEVDIPKYTEQEQIQIVSELDKITTLINLRTEQLKKLDQLIKSRFIELFGDPVSNPHGFPKVSLSELAEIKIGPFGSLLHKEDYIANGHALVNPSHIVAGKISVDDELTVSDEQFSELSAYHLQIGDVVMGRRGEMGRCAVVQTDGLLCGTGSLLIRTKGDVTADYLQKIISFPSFKKTIEDMAVGQTMPNLNVPIVSRFQIIKPPIEVQKAYYTFVEQTDKSKLAIQKSLEKLETLKKALMQKYFG
ncbi:MAG: restriction endonuclease subunit S [Clostridia bacterium]|nr:restriction endonuclease subunit S [Clostridia bacterium]